MKNENNSKAMKTLWAYRRTHPSELEALKEQISNSVHSTYLLHPEIKIKIGQKVRKLPTHKWRGLSIS